MEKSAVEAGHKFVVPTKKIDDPATLENFKKSIACQELLGFIGLCSQAVQKSKMQETLLPDVTRAQNLTLYRA